MVALGLGLVCAADERSGGALLSGSVPGVREAPRGALRPGHCAPAAVNVAAWTLQAIRRDAPTWAPLGPGINFCFFNKIESILTVEQQTVRSSFSAAHTTSFQVLLASP